MQTKRRSRTQIHAGLRGQATNENRNEKLS